MAIEGARGSVIPTLTWWYWWWGICLFCHFEVVFRNNSLHVWHTSVGYLYSIFVDDLMKGVGAWKAFSNDV